MVQCGKEPAGVKFYLGAIPAKELKNRKLLEQKSK